MRRGTLLLLAWCLSLAFGVSVARAIQFSNPTPIAINSTTTPHAASPYPSNISVSGLTGQITDVNVVLSNLSHTFPDDIDILLVGPGGQRMILMADAGSDADATNVTLTFDDQAANQVPQTNPLFSGSQRPGNFEEDVDGCVGSGDTFPAPAPAGPYGSTLAVFNGLSGAALNGTWSLYVVDDCAQFTGQISGGWTLDILTSPPTAVQVRSFSAERERAGTVLRWRTGSEATVAGFNLYREVRGKRARLNAALIRARGGAAGASYRFLDRVAARPALYRLQVVNRDGSRNWAGFRGISGG